jgi:hypothetical protein
MKGGKEKKKDENNISIGKDIGQDGAEAERDKSGKARNETIYIQHTARTNSNATK